MVFGILNCKKEKKTSTAELGHSDLFSLYKSSFAQMPISQERIECILVRINHNGP